MLILIFGMFILMLANYWISKKDLINPAFICSAMFLFSILCAFYNIDLWKINLSDETILLILLSIVSLSLFAALANNISMASKRNKGGKELNQLDYISVENYKFVIVILFGIFTAIVYFTEIVRVARNYGFSSGSGLTVMMNIYRRASNFTENDADNSVSRLASYSFEGLKAFAYLFTYVGINNLLYCKYDLKKEKDEHFKTCNRFFIIPLIYILVSLMTAGRMKLLQFAIYVVILYFILMKKETGWNKTFGIKSIIKLFLIVLIFLMAFVGLRSVVGRTETTGPIEYLTKYIGGSIELLDLFIKDPIPASNIWGKETFYAMYNFLSRRLGVGEWSYLFAKEFRTTVGGVSAGNVYTALRCFYYDFGFMGAVFCSALVGLIFGILYRRVQDRRVKSGIDMSIVAYSYIFYSICLYSINYYFDYISIGFLKTVIIFYIARFFTIKLKIKVRL